MIHQDFHKIFDEVTVRMFEHEHLWHHFVLPNAKLGEPEETPLKGILRLSMDDKIIYVAVDGHYVFLGGVVDLVSGHNISKKGVP